MTNPDLNPYQAPEVSAVAMNDRASIVVRRSGRLFLAVWTLITFWLVFVMWNNAMERIGNPSLGSDSSFETIAGIVIAIAIFIVLPVLPQSYFVGRFLGRKLLVSTKQWMIWICVAALIMIALCALLATGVAYLAYLQNSVIKFQDYLQGIMKAVSRLSIYIVLIHALLGTLQYFLCRKLLGRLDIQPSLQQ